MKQRLSDILQRQQVERVLPPVGFWSRVALWIPFIVMAWVILLLMCGGIIYWLDVLAGIAA